MPKAKKGHIKQQENITIQITKENTRRMFLAAIASVIFFVAVWAQFVVENPILPVAAGRAGMVASVLVEIGAAWVAYSIMASRKRKNYQIVVRIYWILEAVMMMIPMILQTNQIVVMTYLIVLAVTLSVVPIFSQNEQIVALAVELIFSIGWLVFGILDVEHFAYGVVFVVLCNVIGRQAYKSHVRFVQDASRIHSVTNQAETDPMTKLLNRRGLERRLGFIWPMCIRQSMEVAVVMMDIDNFKKYNDTFGHAMGDDCIKKVTSVIHQHTKRKTDYAARVGGEEFLVFLTGIKKQEVIRWAIELKEDVEKMDIPHASDNFLPHVSISMGICHGTPAKLRSEFWEYRNEADRSLYQAKEAGRACIFMENMCYAKTNNDENKKQYLKDRLFHSLK